MSGWIDPYDWIDFCTRFEEMEQRQNEPFEQIMQLDALINLDVVENGKVIAEIRNASFTYCDEAYKCEEKREGLILKRLCLVRRNGSIAFELEIGPGPLDVTINGQQVDIFKLVGIKRFLINKDGGRFEP